MTPCNYQSEGFHNLVPYRWLYKHDKNFLKSKEVTSFMCQSCLAIVHMADVHNHNANPLNKTDETLVAEERQKQREYELDKMSQDGR